MTAEDDPQAARPVVARPGQAAISAVGRSLVIHEWAGAGPPYLHVHRTDDEAWHVLEGALRFTFPDGEVDAPAGTTVFVPAGVPHTYQETAPSRYLVFLTPRLERLIAELHASPEATQVPAVLARYDTELVEGATSAEAVSGSRQAHPPTTP
jgi:mannose-6-phosphate isomerase-like protein (cupin superfamily)